MRAGTLAAALLAALSLSVQAMADEAPSCGSAAQVLAPALDGDFTRVRAEIRPFVNLLGSGGGALSDLAVQHYFRAPWMLGVEASPFAIAGEPEGLGAIAHVRARAAFATDYLEIGAGLGARLQRFGPSGWSFAPAIRLGALDGLSLRGELGYSLIRNYYTRRAELAWADALGELRVPFTRSLALSIEGGYGVDLWAFATLGVKHRLTGTGGRGTTIAGAGLGFVWIVDRFPCQYGDVAPCRGAAWGVGPTMSFSIDHRF